MEAGDDPAHAGEQPGTGEIPEELIVYTGARVARDWDAFDLIFGMLQKLEDDKRAMGADLWTSAERKTSTLNMEGKNRS